MLRCFNARLKPTSRQENGLAALLAQLCELYNMALEQRRDKFRLGFSTTLYEQQCELTQLRNGYAEYERFPAAIQRDPLRRVQRAFDGFFRRCRSGEKPGYPRFRAQHRYNSFTVDAQNFRIECDRLIVVKLGGFRFRTRCRIRGTLKQLVVKRRGSRWAATITCEIGPAPKKVVASSAIGIDLGLTALATLSDGSEIKNPRWMRREEEHVAAANRALSRKVEGSRNRLKAKQRLHGIHQRIRGLRRSYLHQISTLLVTNYDLIALEKLNIRGMARGNFAKSIMDAAWGELVWQITYKAESAGKWAVLVNPKGTTQRCSRCGAIVPKTICDRRHDCPKCGLSLSRDHNSAREVHALGESAVERMAKCLPIK